MKSFLRIGAGLVCATGLGLAWASAANAREVVTETKQQLIPAGPGQRPFDVTRHSIPLRDIKSSVPRDAIPALFRPHFVPASQAQGTLNDSDRVLGVARNGAAKAYPIAVLNYHELVNDEIAGVPILVSWCPLCGSGVVYDPVMEGKRLTFGVSGLLYKRNLLMFDRQTGSLWSQLLAQAVTGPMAGERLTILPAANTTWGAWKQAQPRTLVMSHVTGYARDYHRDPYEGYPLSRQPALLVAVGATAKIFPYAELQKEEISLHTDLGGISLTIEFDHQANAARVGGELPSSSFSIVGFLDDLRVFFPRAGIYESK